MTDIEINAPSLRLVSKEEKGIDLGDVVGLTTGCFDLLHPGHVRYLERCAERCKVLVVGVDSDELVRKQLGSRILYPSPILDAAKRREVVHALACVRMTFVFHRLEELDAVAERLDIAVVFKNERFEGVSPIYGTRGVPERLVIVPDLSGLPSTWDIISAVLSGRVL